MNYNLSQSAPTSNQEAAGRLLQNIAVQSARSVEQARVRFLTSRYGMPPTRAMVVAALYFSEPRQ